MFSFFARQLIYQFRMNIVPNTFYYISSKSRINVASFKRFRSTFVVSAFVFSGVVFWYQNKPVSLVYGFSSDDDANQKKKRHLGKYSHMNFIADIVDQVSPSVVFIESRGQHPFLQNVFQSISSGSGFLVDKQLGILLTNAHVVANSRQVTVKFADGRVMQGMVEFVDDQLDLATIRIASDQVKDLEVIELGESKQSRAGEWVIAVGSPFSLSNTVTVGVISSISRAGRELGIRDDIDYIQTDASINIGNSGGPLLNLEGEAIGINTLKVGEGISFAIPSFYAIDFLNRCSKLRQKDSSWWSRSSRQGPFEHASPVPKRKKYLGFTILTLTPNLIETYRARDPNFPDVRDGVMIYRVVLGSPAHLHGLRTGDVIQSINEHEIKRVNDFYRELESSNQLCLVIRRGHETIRLTVTPQVLD